MQSASSIKAPEPVKKGQRSSKTPAKEAESKDSDKKAEQSLIDVEASVHHGDANESEQSLIADNTSDTVREDQTFGQGELKNVNEYLKGKVGTDILAKHWLKDCKLSNLEKSMVILGLAYELCLAKDPDYDLENEAAENNKQNNFNTKRIFHILKYVTAKVLPEDRKKFTEFICQSGNVKLLEKICQQEKEDGGGKIKAKVNRQYLWKGEFTGYKRLTDLLQYVLKQPCSPEVVLCIAKKVYGNAHIICNGKQYLYSRQIAHIKVGFDYQSSVIEDCLKAAIKLSYKDVVQVMLGGDIYHCIRLIKDEKFQEEKRFSEALKMIEETVAEVMSSWVNDKRQSFKGDVQRLLKEGIEVDINTMGNKDLIDIIECLGIELKDKNSTTKKELVEMLKREGRGKVRLRKTVVGALISTLFFNYQNELTKELFELKISKPDESRREEEIEKLIDAKSFVKEKVLEKIKLLNKNSHIFSHWFSREVLAAIVNDEERFNKLKAVCTAICKEKVEELLEGAEVHEDVADALKFFGVKPNQIKTSTPKKGHSVVSVPSHFSQEIEETDKALREVKGIVREMSKWGSESSEYEILSLVKILLSDKTPAFSGLSRKIIVELKSKKKEKDIKSDEVKKLKETVNQILGEIKKGINMLAKGDSEYCIDTEDTLKHFEIINSEIKREDKREIVELVCQDSNVKLLEMICQQENKDGGGKVQVDRQYLWKGEFTGYERLTDLLQYVLKQPCSSEIVLCIAKKVYGTYHNVLSGKKYLENSTIQSMEEKVSQPNSVVEECLKAAIELGYKNVVSAMLGGDIYQCIRLMKGEKFQEEFSKALKMIEETVAEVMSSLVNDERQSFKDDIQRLLKEGIKVDVGKMDKKDLIGELEDRGIEIKSKKNTTKEELVEMLKGEGEGGGKVRLSKTVVGGLISTLFFNYRDELMEEPFELKIILQDKSRREKEINELNKNINDESFVKKKVLEKIKLLNSNSHISNNWFFREMLSAIVNDKGRLGKLKAVCAAICKEEVEELLEGAKVHKDVVDALKFFGVDTTKRDLGTVGPVETMDLNEYISPSSEQFLTETNKLSGQDIVDIAKYYYRWMEPINGKYLEDTNEKVFFTCTDVPSLEDKLKHYKEIQQKDLIFTSIINTGKDHWVTLVVARSVKDGKFSAYYCDSFGKGLSKKMLDVLKKALKIDANRISSSRIEQQEDEYNCGIFALANADKITRIIKDKSFTEINVELKGKLDAGQLRKEFAKKVEEMRQSERNSKANSEDESVIMQDSVENVSSRQPSASRDLQETSSTVPAERLAKANPVPLGPRAAGKNNERFMQSNCRQNQNIHYNKKRVHIAASGGDIFNEVKVFNSGTYAGEDWSRRSGRGTKRKREEKTIPFPIPNFVEFILMLNEEYRDKLLEYEFNYERLGFLHSYGSGSDFSNMEDYFPSNEEEDKKKNLELPVFSQSNDDNKEYAIDTYIKAISQLRNGKKENAVKDLKDLAVQGMPHAQYAFAIIEFKDLWASQMKYPNQKLYQNQNQDELISTIIDWLNSSNHDNNLRPLNKSLFLKVLLYDIGGYAQLVRERTGATLDSLLQEILSVTRTKGTTINFDEGLVKTTLPLGKIIEDGIDKTNDFQLIIRFAMYELLKLKMSQGGLQAFEEYCMIEDAFTKICESLPRKRASFLEAFDYACAEMMYGHAINLLIRGGDDNNRRALKLLNDSCKLGHHLAQYLRGTFLYRNEFFTLISQRSERVEYLDGLERFAVCYKNKTAASMVANEYLKKRDGCIVDPSEEKAKDILISSGFKDIWETFSKEKPSQKISLQLKEGLLISPKLPGKYPIVQAGTSGSEDCEIACKRSRYSNQEVVSNKVPNRREELDALSLSEPPANKNYPAGPYSNSSRSTPKVCAIAPTQTSKNMNESMTELGDKKNKVEGRQFVPILNVDSLPFEDILKPRRNYFFYTRKRDNQEDLNFIRIEEYYNARKYDDAVRLCNELIDLKGIPDKNEIACKAYYNKGEMLCIKGKDDEAMKVFGEVFHSGLITEDSQRFLVARSMARIYCKNGKNDSALKLLRDINKNLSNIIPAISNLINSDIDAIRENSKTRVSLLHTPNTRMSSTKSERHMDVSMSIS